MAHIKNFLYKKNTIRQPEAESLHEGGTWRMREKVGASRLGDGVSGVWVLQPGQKATE